MLLVSIAANAILILHVAYVALVVFGLLWIWLGIALRWESIRNRWFRGFHLVMIIIVVLEAWAGITCPLTVWENYFRHQAGAAAYEGDFIAIWLQSLIFFEAPPWVFTLGYTTFGLAVIATLGLAPPSWTGVEKQNGSRDEDGE